MKIVKTRTILLAGIAGGVGYVLGAKAGRGRFEELKAQADKLRSQAEKLAGNPKVQETVGNVADKVKETAAKLPDPVADVVTKVADSATAAGSSTGSEGGEAGDGEAGGGDDDGGQPLATDVTSTATPEVDPGGAAAGTPVSGITVSDVAGPDIVETENSPGV
jgi:hypothetical protein